MSRIDMKCKRMIRNDKEWPRHIEKQRNAKEQTGKEHKERYGI